MVNLPFVIVNRRHSVRGKRGEEDENLMSCHYEENPFKIACSSAAKRGAHYDNSQNHSSCRRRPTFRPLQNRAVAGNIKPFEGNIKSHHRHLMVEKLQERTRSRGKLFTPPPASHHGCYTHLDLCVLKSSDSLASSPSEFPFCH